MDCCFDQAKPADPHALRVQPREPEQKDFCCYSHLATVSKRSKKNRLRHLRDLATAAAENAGLWHQVAISRLGSGRWNSSGVGSGVNRIAAALRMRRFTGSASSAG